MRRLAAALLVAAAAALCCGRAAAHDIPDEVHLHAFVKPEGEVLHLVVRIPLALLLNLNLPKRGAGYIDLDAVGDAMPRAIAATGKGIDLYADGVRLEPARGRARISLPSDRAFESYAAAEALIRGPPLPATTDVFWNQGWFDAHLEYPIRADAADFALRVNMAPGLGDRFRISVRYLPADGTVRAFSLTGGADAIHLDPQWFTAAATFVRSGFVHILDGVDHLLFLLCLVAPFRRATWSLLWVVTSFTVAHSLTLIAGAYGVVPRGDWFPPLVEVLIAASILYMAIENVARPDLRRRWAVAGLFGLVHGFAFSFILKEQLQLAGDHLLLSLLAFNVGVELGQLAVLAVALPLLILVLGRSPRRERVGLVVLSLVAGHTAWHWLVERWGALREAEWPALDSLDLTQLLLWGLPAVAVVTAAGALVRALRQRPASSAPDADVPRHS